MREIGSDCERDRAPDAAAQQECVFDPEIIEQAVRMARKKMWVTHAKAASELAYCPGEVNSALERAVQWFRSNDYC